MNIFLDAGHSVGGGDAGAEGFDLKEQDITFGIVMLLAKKLSDVGFDIMLLSKSGMQGIKIILCIGF